MRVSEKLRLVNLSGKLNLKNTIAKDVELKDIVGSVAEETERLVI